MCEQNLRQLSCQVSNTEKSLWHRRVHWMSAEVKLLLLDGDRDWLSINDVLL